MQCIDCKDTFKRIRLRGIPLTWINNYVIVRLVTLYS